jgi:cytochrome c1
MHRFAFKRLHLLVIAAAIAVATGAAWQWQSSRSQTRDVAHAMTDGDASQAPVWIRRYGCGGCHTIPGITGADGKVGAPLQNLRERVYIAGVVPNTADNLVQWIVNPQSFSSQTAMPATGISESEARDVAAFLYSQ